MTIKKQSTCGKSSSKNDCVHTYNYEYMCMCRYVKLIMVMIMLLDMQMHAYDYMSYATILWSNFYLHKRKTMPLFVEVYPILMFIIDVWGYGVNPAAPEPPSSNRIIQTM